MDDEITKDGPIRSQTQLEMFRRLHNHVNEWKRPHQFMPRQTDHAFLAMERWVEQGILEVADPNDPNCPTGPGAYCVEYRLAREHWNGELAAMDIDRRMRQALASRDRAHERLARSRTEAEAAWPTLCDAMEHAAAQGADASPAHRASLAEVLARAARAVEWAPQGLERSEMDVARSESELEQVQAAEAMLMDRVLVGPDGDPLGGDA